MAQVNIPVGYSELTFKWQTPGGRGDAFNVMGVAYDTEASLTDVTDEVQIAANAFAQGFSDQYLLESVRMRLGAATPPYPFFDIPVQQTGDQTGEPVPMNTSVLVSKVSLTAGRPGRGLSYFAGLCLESETDGNGEIDPSGWGRMSVLMNDLRSAFSSDDLMGMVILHPEGSPLAEFPSGLVNYTVQTTLATHKSRLRG